MEKLITGRWESRYESICSLLLFEEAHCILKKLHTETLRVHKIFCRDLIGLCKLIEELAPDGYMAKAMPRGQNEKRLFPKVKFNFEEFYNDIPVVFSATRTASLKEASVLISIADWRITLISILAIIGLSAHSLQSGLAGFFVCLGWTYR